MGAHLIDGEFQSDKYPSTPRGKVPLSVKDPDAQDLLWEYAQRHRKRDAEFSTDLETAFRQAGYNVPHSVGVPELDVFLRDLKVFPTAVLSNKMVDVYLTRIMDAVVRRAIDAVARECEKSAFEECFGSPRQAAEAIEALASRIRALRP